MKTTIRKGLLLALLAPLTLQGCFFFFIPGSAITKLSDTITGQRGDHCVSVTAQIGNQVRLPNGQYGVIKELHGETSRCTNPDTPIRALIEIVRTKSS